MCFISALTFRYFGILRKRSCILDDGRNKVLLFVNEESSFFFMHRLYDFCIRNSEKGE